MKARVKAKSRGKSKTGAAAKTKAIRSRKRLNSRKSAKPSRTTVPKIDPLDNWITAAAQGLGLKLEKPWMAAVRANLQVTLDQAFLVAEFPLPDDAEPAPIFRA
jgi:hypothetical protein